MICQVSAGDGGVVAVVAVNCDRCGCDGVGDGLCCCNTGYFGVRGVGDGDDDDDGDDAVAEVLGGHCFSGIGRRSGSWGAWLARLASLSSLRPCDVPVGSP